MREFDKQWALREAKFIYQVMTQYRWYSRVGLTWEEYQARICLERDRFRARMYEILVLGIY